MSRPTRETILEHHRVLEEVMQGKVDPRCKRAQDAFRVATKYPRWMLEQAATPPQFDRRVSSSASPPFPTPPPVGAPDEGRAEFLQTLFGSAAPHAESAMEFAATDNGKKLGGIAAVVLATLLASKLS